MKKRNYFLLAAVACVSGLNLFLSINGQNLSSGLKLLTVEAIANAEYNPNAPLDKRYVPHGCGIENKVIVGNIQMAALLCRPYMKGDKVLPVNLALVVVRRMNARKS